MKISSHEREICLRVLQQISEDPSVINEDERMKGLIAKIHTQGKKGQRRTIREARVNSDRQLNVSTRIVQKHQERALIHTAQTLDSALTPPMVATNETNETPSLGELSRPLRCYVCKQQYTEIHWFYHQLCRTCADFNWQKRQQRAPLEGRIALLTGGRIKIGYEVALKLLRDGARVLLTTRFPCDAVRRFSKEADFEQWQERLQIFGLDLRDVPAVEGLAAQLLETLPHLDIIIHNAAQTVKRPLEFYRHLLENENLRALPDGTQGLLASSPNVSYALSNEAVLLERHPLYRNETFSALEFPRGYFDADGQQLDARFSNSWRLTLDQVSTLEMLEVHLVSAVAPFVLNAKLKPLLLRSPHSRRFIVNVSAMEGQFARESKTWFHPHTNMAKAALNMMTRTSANDYARDGIYMNSVDTGWITDENPQPRAARIREIRHFYPPLDAIDGAARIYDPIVQGINGLDEPIYGYFLKDYAPHAW